MDLESFLQQHGIAFEKHDHPTAYTAQELAHEEHVSGYLVAKPVIVKGQKGFTMCVLPAPKQLDLDRAAKLLQEQELRLATESEMAEQFPGCELGAEPPMGILFGLKTLMDEQLQQVDHLVMQAGTHTEAIKVGRVDWERACQPVVAPIAAGAA